MKKTELKNNLVLSTFYQVLTMVLPLITAPYASRILGVDGTGIYSYTHSYVMYFMLFGALGTVSYGTREIARHRNNKNERSQIFWEIASLTFLTSFVAIIAWGVWILFNETYRIYYIILTVYILGTMFDISWFYAGMEEFKYTVSQNSIFKILGAISIFIFVKKPDDLWIYILILALTTLLANISMWIYLPRFINRIPLRSIQLKKHFKETLVYFVPTIATSVYTILDKTLIGIITHNTRENGNYEQATKIINMAKSFCFVGVNTVLSSRISYLFSEKKHEEIKRRISVSMNYILFIGIAVCFGLIGISKRFVPFFFGPGYNKTITLLQLMSPLTVIIGISSCLGLQYYNPAGLRAKSARFIIAGSIVNLLFNLLLIPKYESYGAAIATIIAETIISSLYLYSCNGYYLISSLFMQSWKKMIAGVFMLIIVLLLGEVIERDFFALVAQVTVGAVAYFAILFLEKDDFMCNIVLLQGKIFWKRITKQ